MLGLNFLTKIIDIFLDFLMLIIVNVQYKIEAEKKLIYNVQ